MPLNQAPVPVGGCGGVIVRVGVEIGVIGRGVGVGESAGVDEDIGDDAGVALAVGDGVGVIEEVVKLVSLPYDVPALFWATNLL